MTPKLKKDRQEFNHKNFEANSVKRANKNQRRAEAAFREFENLVTKNTPYNKEELIAMVLKKHKVQ